MQLHFSVRAGRHHIAKICCCYLSVSIQRSRPSPQEWWAGCVLTQHFHWHQTPSRSDLVHCRPETNTKMNSTCKRYMYFFFFKSLFLWHWHVYTLTVLMAILASKLSTQLRTKSTGFPSSSPPWLKTHSYLLVQKRDRGRKLQKIYNMNPNLIQSMKCVKFSIVVML